MIKITVSHPTKPLTSALYPESLEAQVIANLERNGYTVLMVETQR